MVEFFFFGLDVKVFVDFLIWECVSEGRRKTKRCNKSPGDSDGFLQSTIMKRIVSRPYLQCSWTRLA